MDSQITGNDFKDRLSELMEERNINQRELAEKIGISKQTISFYVNGKRLPDIDNFSLICEHFKVSADFMLGKTDSKSIDMEISTIHEKLGLSDGAIIILEKLKNKESELLPLLSRIIEQESINIDEEEDLIDENECFSLDYEPSASVLSNIYKSITFLRYVDKNHHKQLIIKPDGNWELKQEYPIKELLIKPDGNFEIVDALEGNDNSLRIEINDFIHKRLDDDILYALSDLIVAHYI
ncbi:helix-turn-helix domain-containing protein [Acetobacterium bakii]|uniref:helix-turn-helix domain-containing protein n=1 Tax=Acetobacterium bakii TaxID=52689 RepID=UPI0006822111|nr:helix-turn-helix transcriptional regulator [Acetobacterium bakii]